MNKRIAIILLTFMMLISGSIPPAYAEQNADIAITKTADRKHVKIGNNITFTITLTNGGPGIATGILFGDPLPDELNLVSFSCSQGPVEGQSFCAVDRLAKGASVTATLVATPITNPAQSERRFTNTAFFSGSTSFDPNSRNNTDSLKLRIVGEAP